MRSRFGYDRDQAEGRGVFLEALATADALSERRKAIWAIFERISATPKAGTPTLANGAEVTDLTGLRMRQVHWTEDRGQSMWQGAVLALEAMGVDLSQPL